MLHLIGELLFTKATPLDFYDLSRDHTLSNQLEEIRKMEFDQLSLASFIVIYDR